MKSKESRPKDLPLQEIVPDKDKEKESDKYNISIINSILDDLRRKDEEEDRPSNPTIN